MDLIEGLSQKEKHPVCVDFIDWFNENRNRLPEAFNELGIEAPEEGPGLFKRIQEAVIPVLEREKF